MTHRIGVQSKQIVSEEDTDTDRESWSSGRESSHIGCTLLRQRRGDVENRIPSGTLEFSRGLHCALC